MDFNILDLRNWGPTVGCFSVYQKSSHLNWKEIDFQWILIQSICGVQYLFCFKPLLPKIISWPFFSILRVQQLSSDAGVSAFELLVEEPWWWWRSWKIWIIIGSSFALTWQNHHVAAKSNEPQSRCPMNPCYPVDLIYGFQGLQIWTSHRQAGCKHEKSFTATFFYLEKFHHHQTAHREQTTIMVVWTWNPPKIISKYVMFMKYIGLNW